MRSAHKWKDVLSPAWMARADTFLAGCTMGRIASMPAGAVAEGAMVLATPEAATHTASFPMPETQPQTIPTVEATVESRVQPEHVIERKVRAAARKKRARN